MSVNDPDAPLVKVRGLTKAFGTNQVLKGIDLDVPKGAVVSIIGASASGKTTLLRCINLLETYDAGSIEVDGVEVGYHLGSAPAAPAANASSPGFGPIPGWCSSILICFRT
jgi:ABC-type polar amino acid transport system ATPase subunit